MKLRSTLDLALIAQERSRRGPPVIRQDQHGREIYEPDGQVLSRFVMSDAKVDVIVGPLAGGKTICAFRRIGRHMMQQAKSPRDGLRKTRWFVARPTYPELKRTTIRTWQRVWPASLYGEVKMSPPFVHNISFGDVRATVDFLALDDDDDIEKLRSADYTGGMFHEIQYTQLSLVREARSRCNRYPEESEGGATWHGIIGDANAPDEDTWLAMMTGKVDLPDNMSDAERRAMEWPKDWGYFEQPPAVVKIRDQRGEFVRYEVNLDAENLRWLASDYYLDQLEANPPNWIDNRLGNESVLVVDGSPVWPMFRRDFHVARSSLKPVRGHDVFVWLDFGRVYPAALFAQEISGRVYIQREMLGFNEPATVFAPKVRRVLNTDYEGCSFRCVGDPKGQDKGQATDDSAYEIFRANGMPVTPAPVKQNNIEARTEAVAYALNDNPGGIPYIQISPNCRVLIVGMAGRYQLTKEEGGELIPKKDKYANLCDCLQYGMIGIGVGRRMTGRVPIGDLRPTRVYKRKSLRRVAA